MELAMTRPLWQTALGLLGWLLACYLVAALAAGVSPGLSSNTAWYQQLIKPAWNPPNWLFGPVWSTLYTLMGISAWLIWKEYGFEGAGFAISVFLLQLLLNGLWSFFFFEWKMIGAAFIEIILLVLTIIYTMYVFSEYSALAAWLLAPYLAWVSFATALTGTIWWLNRVAS